MLFYVEFPHNQRKFVDAAEMRLKWPWIAVSFLEPQLSQIDSVGLSGILSNQMCKTAFIYIVYYILMCIFTYICV